MWGFLTFAPPSVAATLDQFGPAVTKPKYGLLTKNLKTCTTWWFDGFHNCDNLLKAWTIISLSLCFALWLLTCDKRPKPEKQHPTVAVEIRKKSLRIHNGIQVGITENFLFAGTSVSLPSTAIDSHRGWKTDSSWKHRISLASKSRHSLMVLVPCMICSKPSCERQ